MIKTIIIDDDYVSRIILKDLLKKFLDNIELVGEAASVIDGVDIIEEMQPDLVLLDINLPDGTGFDILDKIKSIDFKIIFITAYSEYAIKAFKYAAFDYIVKPINIDELTKAILRIPSIKKIESKTAVKTLKENFFSHTEDGQKTIALPEQSGFAIIKVDEIIRCEGKRNYTKIIFRSAESKIISRTLLEFEKLLTPHGFVRIHRSHLVRIAEVNRYLKSNGGQVELKTGELLPVSPNHKEELLNTILYNKL